MLKNGYFIMIPTRRFWTYNLFVPFLILGMNGKCRCTDEETHSGPFYNFTYIVQSREHEESTETYPDEQRLMAHLLKGYEKSVRPVRNATTPVIIRMGLTLTQIFDMDEKNQVLVTNVWLDQEWVDEFLRWDPVTFNNISTLRIPCHKIWLPDIVLYNNAAEYTDGFMPANAMVQTDGNIFWPVPTKLQSSCKVDVTYFPFDEQTCTLKFGSWTYDGYQVDITNRTTDIDLSNYIINGEWQLIDIKVVRNVVYYACCLEPFPDVTFYIQIRRRTLYYMYNVIFPCMMMSALTLLVFCLPPESGEKIALGITVLLAFSVFMLAVAENLPETSEFVPLISIYLTIVMSLTSISVIMTVFVLNLHHRGPSTREIPLWIKNIFLEKISSLFCLKREPRYAQCFTEESKFLRNLSVKLTLDNISQELQNEIQMENNVSESVVIETQGNTLQDRRECTFHPGQTANHRKQHSNRSYTHPTTNEEILQSLKKILEKHEREDRDFEIIQEWRRFAQIMDRILFWLFLVGTLMSTIAVLVIAPASR